MSEVMKLGILIVLGIVIAGLFSGGIYSVAGGNNAYVVNKFTGRVWWCAGPSCTLASYK